MKHFSSLATLFAANGIARPEHPLLGLATCKEYKNSSFGNTCFTGDFYLITLMKFCSGNFSYGRTSYGGENGSMIYIAPRQTIELKDLTLLQKGFIIFVHEDYLIDTALHQEIRKYGFFQYDVHEALHLSASEEEDMWDLYGKIAKEYAKKPDEFSREIIVSLIASLLLYSQRFYKRQFMHRTEFGGSLYLKITAILREYFSGGSMAPDGLPTVKKLASKVNVSVRYLTNRLKTETGKTAQKHIHMFLMEEAKNLIIGTDNTLSQTAYQLGFENPPYFSRLFKKEVGMTPTEFKEVHFRLN